MRGAIPSLSHYAFMAWCLVKHRDNFTFILRRVRWEGEGTSKGKVRNVNLTIFQSGNMKEKNHLGDLGINGGVNLNKLAQDRSK
jgi:hypothetical protein